MLQLRLPTDADWADFVLADFDNFLRDHAGCERKASATAMSLVGHYPDRTELVEAMLEVALEELDHFRRVYEILKSRGGALAPDVKDPYVAELRTQLSRGTNRFFLDRLLISGIIEARSAERLGLIARALGDGPMREFYQELTRCEAKHHAVFVRLAECYYPSDVVRPRLAELLDFEASVLARLPRRVAVH